MAKMLSRQKARKKRARQAAEASRNRGPRVKAADIDYKDVATLQRLVSAQGKLFSRKRTGLNAECQRRVALALKRARFMALLPYVT
ncbi:MAG: 30S ribosomal protein S18 [Planctomycetota bacterium]